MLCLYLILLIHLCLNMIYQYGSCGFHWFWVFGLIWHNSFMLFFWACSWWMTEIEDLVFWVITVREKRTLKVSFVDVWGWLWLSLSFASFLYSFFRIKTNKPSLLPSPLPHSSGIWSDPNFKSMFSSHPAYYLIMAMKWN